MIGYRHLKKESVLELLLSFVQRTSAATNVQTRTIYDEFFEVPHQCHPNRPGVLTFPWLPTIKEFLDTVNLKSADQAWLSGVSSNTTQDWLYNIVTQECLGRPMVSDGYIFTWNLVSTKTLLFSEKLGGKGAIKRLTSIQSFRLAEEAFHDDPDNGRQED